MSSHSAAGTTPGRGRFATAQWSRVLAGGELASSAGAEALARLCSLYWYPVFAFVRRQGYPTDKAQDLTQGFFTRLIEKGDFGDANECRGRFRSFLLAACQHFLSNEGDRARALERGGDLLPVSIDVVAAEARYQRALAHAETPEGLYERQWSLTLLASVLQGLRDEYAASGREQVFKRLKDYLTGDEGDGGQADAARDLKMTTTAVKVAVHRLRRRYREELRRRVADTVESDQDIDGEIQHLLQSLSRSPGGL